MAQTSAPWTGTTTGDAGPYGAQTWQRIWSQITGWDNDSNDTGVLAGIFNELQITPTTPASQQVIIETGSALVQGTWYENNAQEFQTIQANGSGNDREDLIVLRADYVAQTVRVAYKVGTPAVTPTPPSLTQIANTTWEIPLAVIEADNGFATITADKIRDRRSYANTGNTQTQQVINQSASVLRKGTVVIQDTANSGYPVNVTTTSAEDNRYAFGIIEDETLASGGAGRVITYGVTPVICDESVSVGDFLYLSSTAGEAGILIRPLLRPFGIVIEANTGANTACLAFVNFPPQDFNYDVSVFNVSTQGTAAGVEETLEFDVVVDDRFGQWNTVTNEFTAVYDGRALLLLNCTVRPGTLGTTFIEIERDTGAGYAGYARNEWNTIAGAGTNEQDMTVIVGALVRVGYKFRARVETAGNGDVGGVSGNRQSFSIIPIGFT